MAKLISRSASEDSKIEIYAASNSTKFGYYVNIKCYRSSSGLLHFLTFFRFCHMDTKKINPIFPGHLFQFLLRYSISIANFLSFLAPSDQFWSSFLDPRSLSNRSCLLHLRINFRRMWSEILHRRLSKIFFLLH